MSTKRQDREACKARQEIGAAWRAAGKPQVSKGSAYKTTRQGGVRTVALGPPVVRRGAYSPARSGRPWASRPIAKGGM